MALTARAMAGDSDSTLAQYADVFLDVSVTGEACPLGLAPTASTTAMMAVGDALAVALFEEKGFSADDFALLHPGGALGRRLLTVGELMHTGDDVPLVPAAMPLKDALYTISDKRMGVVGVLDASGALAGVITDGDVRRAMARGVDVYAAKAADIMTAGPKRVLSGELAAVALRKMETFSITSLFVYDAQDPSRLAGIVHVHDLLKAGF